MHLGGCCGEERQEVLVSLEKFNCEIYRRSYGIQSHSLRQKRGMDIKTTVLGCPEDPGRDEEAEGNGDDEVEINGRLHISQHRCTSSQFGARWANSPSSQ